MFFTSLPCKRNDCSRKDYDEGIFDKLGTRQLTLLASFVLFPASLVRGVPRKVPYTLTTSWNALHLASHRHVC